MCYQKTSSRAMLSGFSEENERLDRENCSLMQWNVELDTGVIREEDIRGS